MRNIKVWEGLGSKGRSRSRNRGMEKGRSRSRNRDRSRSRDKGRNRGEKCKSEWRLEQEAIDLLKQKGYTIYKSKATKEELCTARRTVNDIINTARKELSNKLKSDLPEHANLNKKIEEDPYNYIPGTTIFKALRTPSRNDGEPCPLYNAHDPQNTMEIGCGQASGHIDPSSNKKLLHICSLCLSQLSGLKSAHPCIKCPAKTTKHLTRPAVEWEKLTRDEDRSGGAGGK